MLLQTLSNYLLRRWTIQKFIIVLVATIIGVGLRFLLKSMCPQLSERTRSTVVTVVVLIIVVVAAFVLPANW